MSYLNDDLYLLTDFYQISMAYSYWKHGKHDESAVFEVFFRKNPFKGEFTIFAGLSDLLPVIKNFKYSTSDIDYLKKLMPDCDAAFFQYLANLNAKNLKIWAMQEGDMVFPNVPIYIIEGPVILCQLLETIILNLTNFSSLICTNAFRHRICAMDGNLIELGLRRAQGPNGGLTASKYSYIGGFNSTSNVLAGKMYDIPVKGTMAHSFVSSYLSSDIDKIFGQVKKAVTYSDRIVKCEEEKPLEKIAFTQRCYQWLLLLAELFPENINLEYVRKSELISFADFAVSFPKGFVALLDTYDALKSGLYNYCSVALALLENGYSAVGIRIDSGDLAFQSVMIKAFLKEVSHKLNVKEITDFAVVISNDLDEDTIRSMNQQQNAIDAYGIGTNLVTCQKQPALGCVYKLVSISGIGAMKISANIEKQTLPGKKFAYRLLARDGTAIADLIQLDNEAAPEPLKRILIRHSYDEHKKAIVVPSGVKKLHQLVFENGNIKIEIPSVHETRKVVMENLKVLRSDHIRYLNPTPYKVSVSQELYEYVSTIRTQLAPIEELK